MTQNNPLKELFEISIQNEISAGNVYFKLSELFSETPKVSELWKTMQEDEKEHAKILQDVLASLPEDKLLLRSIQQQIERLNDK